ncbi:MAG: hypothetical protein HPY30_03900 [Gammaproteobacteria bacterium (ex Lamellibrachia satsuma)]|nr:MAG: hypothetical protein HPY30_03900 [Gammaproteobacteria bacterium (ex Lamellibrachia satsuma)]
MKWSNGLVQPSAANSLDINAPAFTVTMDHYRLIWSEENRYEILSWRSR